ncbi:MAG TPA: methionine synthase [Deltaproteobacteria bacterium]|nr:methionine synthase [Deltaproteobacteria bacterium]
MKQTVIFETITFDPPLDIIYRRLGYRRKTTVLAKKDRDTIDRAIDMACTLIHLKGAARRIAVDQRDESRVILEGGTVFAGSRLAALLRDCDEVLLMGATTGNDILDAVAADTREENLSRAVVLDATASEMVDMALDWITSYFNNLLRREGKRLLKRRYSAGYGDFSLDHQRSFFDLLELHRIGVAINDRSILAPEKSVTAVTGIVHGGNRE